MVKLVHTVVTHGAVGTARGAVVAAGGAVLCGDGVAVDLVVLRGGLHAAEPQAGGKSPAGVQAHKAIGQSGNQAAETPFNTHTHTTSPRHMTQIFVSRGAGRPLDLMPQACSRMPVDVRAAMLRTEGPLSPLPSAPHPPRHSPVLHIFIWR